VVCKRFDGIFLPVYLTRSGLGDDPRFIRLQCPPAFKAFRLLHRSSQLKSEIHFTAYLFSVPAADVERAVSDLTYAISRVPVGTFESIDLSFSSSKSVGVRALSNVMQAIAQTRCPMIEIAGCSVAGPGRINSIGFATWPIESLDIHGDLTPSAFRPLAIAVSPFLVNLRLRTGTAATKWEPFLNSLHLPQLEKIALSEDVSLPALIKFLNRHPKISQVSIAHDYQSPTREDFPVVRSKLNMSNIDTLSGPIPWLLAMLRNAKTPPSLSLLCITAQRPPYRSIAPAIFQCLMMCDTVQTLEVSLPTGSCQEVLKLEDRSDQEPRFTHLKTDVFKLSFIQVFNSQPVPDDDVLVSHLYQTSRCISFTHN
jgi:hypothetical protein